MCGILYGDVTCFINFQVGRTQSILTGDTGNWDSVGDMEPSSQVSRIQIILTGGDTGKWDSVGDMEPSSQVSRIQSKILIGGYTGNWDSVGDMEPSSQVSRIQSKILIGGDTGNCDSVVDMEENTSMQIEYRAGWIADMRRQRELGQ
jgi:hypothetical protein